ncbi:DNA-binding protein [Arthrobacter sp.]|uniref:DNA-binding protein n=1 Tax=Arthrobacter sp. TaxID=1667 RepID=UPI0033915713
MVHSGLAAHPTADHLLPPIGGPATRALVSAGMTDLDTVARHSQAELLALHGVGPKAVRILTEALAASGQSLRADG